MYTHVHMKTNICEILIFRVCITWVSIAPQGIEVVFVMHVCSLCDLVVLRRVPIAPFA